MRIRGRYHQKSGEAGFAISTEVLLIGVIFVCGLITGWAKFRDQSLAEIKDSIQGIDRFITGATPLLKPYSQRWIVGAAVTCSSTGDPCTSSTPFVSQSYIPPGGGTAVDASSHTLVYATGPTASSSTSASENSVF